MTKQNLFKKIISLFFVIALSIILGCDEMDLLPQKKDENYCGLENKLLSIEERNCFVEKVVDGDTINVICDGSKQKKIVRFIGMDTPELTHGRSDKEKEKKENPKKFCHGQQAKQALAKKLAGKKVTLYKDHDGNLIDKYGRILRYVTLDNCRNINEEMIEDGFARFYGVYYFTLMEDFEQAEKKAKKANLEVWDAC